MLDDAHIRGWASKECSIGERPGSPNLKLILHRLEPDLGRVAKPQQRPDLTLPGRGDDQNHAERGDVAPPLTTAAALEAPDRAARPRPPPLPASRALARPHGSALA